MAEIKTIFSKQEISQIFTEYNLGAVQSFNVFETGWVQTNLFIQTEAGKFVFRYYEQGNSQESILFEVNLLKYLGIKNYHCQKPLKNKNGKYIGSYNGKFFVVFEYLTGEHLDNPTEDQLKELIHKVADLHILTRSYVPKYKPYRNNYGIEFCKNTAIKKAHEINTPNAYKKLEWYLNQIASLQLPKSLARGICHCDANFSNVLFEKGKINALIDFDSANYTFLAFDLVYLLEPFIPSFEWNTWQDFNINDNVFDFSRAKMVVKEYEKYRRLIQNEKQHLFDLMKLYVLLDCLWFFERGEFEDFFEKRKMGYLNKLGREMFCKEIFEK